MNTLFAAIPFLCLAPFVSHAKPDILLVVGAPGAEDYAGGFADAAEAWRDAASRADADITIIGLDAPSSDDTAGGELTDRSGVLTWLSSLPADGTLPVWFIYVGHGTYDGREARLNLRGPDLAMDELGDGLARLKRPLVVVHGGSASGPFLPALSGPDRIIVTATEIGYEVNYARFGERFAASVANPDSDIDQDGQTTVLEAFLNAAREVELFYAESGRMASEHPLIDDNGDKRGTPPEWFSGTRAVKQADDGAEVDGVAARRLALVESPEERALSDDQRVRRNDLEDQLERLRTRKAKIIESEYLRELEIILRELTAVYFPGGSPTEVMPQPDATDSAATDGASGSNTSESEDQTVPVPDS